MGDDKYFHDYENLEIHELMLRDRPRQVAYYEAIKNNSSLFKNKVVLDVGAGTGILSIFCAKAGARLVYSVEASKLAKIAIETIEENHLSGVIKVIQSTIENFQLPSDTEKVDIIVSEWMGFYLLHEGMLDSVIFARNKFLRDGGLMFPQYATIYIAPCSVPSRFEYWKDIDGVQMTKFAARLREAKSNKPDIMTICAQNLLHDGIVMNWLDLCQVTSDELNEISIQEVVAIQKVGQHQGFCIWFECQFPSTSEREPVILSTSPKAPETHWKQCTIILPDHACESVESGEPIAFKISMKRNEKDFRKYNLEVEILNPDSLEHPLPCYCHMTKCILTKAHLESVEKNNADREMLEP